MIIWALPLGLGTVLVTWDVAGIKSAAEGTLVGISITVWFLATCLLLFDVVAVFSKAILIAVKKSLHLLWWGNIDRLLLLHFFFIDSLVHNVFIGGNRILHC